MENKVVVITGAFGGIGKAISNKFAEEGAKLVLWDILIDEDYCKQLEKKGVEYIAMKVDITNSEDIEKATNQIIEKFETVDILINNAGITKDKIVLKMTEEEWNEVIDVNLKGAFLCSKIIGRIMFSRKKGKIINIASIIGQIGNIGQANYAASKGGLIALTKVCAKEFARANINVNAIAPGYIMTRMTENLPEKIKEDMLNKIPMRRFGTPEEVAELVLFLGSNKSNYITGQVIRIDGGLVM